MLKVAHHSYSLYFDTNLRACLDLLDRSRRQLKRRLGGRWDPDLSRDLDCILQATELVQEIGRRSWTPQN